MIDWYNNLESRERVLVTCGTVAVLLTLLFLLVLEPLSEARVQAETRYKSAVDLQSYMHSTQNKVERLKLNQSQQKNRVPPDQLIGLIDQELKMAGVATDLKGIKPEAGGGVRLRFDEVGFDALVLWMVNFSNRHAVMFDQVTVNQTAKPGRVRASLLVQ